MDGSYKSSKMTARCLATFNACGASKVEDRFLSGLTVVPQPDRGEVRITLPSGFPN